MDNFMFSDYAKMFNINPESLNEFNNYMNNYYNGILQNYYNQLGSKMNMFKVNPDTFMHYTNNPVFNNSLGMGFQG